MRALIENKAVSNGRNYGGEKELICAYTVLGKIDGEMREVVTARAYMGRSRSASTVYASIWIHANGYHLAGHGSAGGYGYHKESAAFADAIRSAGIQLIGSPYADDKGMVYIDVPNPEWDAAKAEANEDNYNWHTPKMLHKMVKDTGKNPCHIGGCGEQSMRSAFMAIARSVGAKGKLIFVQH
jgi:hypothetical protein